MWKIGMPNLGHTMEQGTVNQWLKREGDPVAKGEIIVVIESDKASYEVESPGAGVLLRIVADVGGVVPVGGTMGVVGAPGEAVPDLGPAPAVAPPALPPASGAVAPAPARVTAAGPPGGGRVQVSPLAKALAQKLGVDLATVAGTGPGGLVTKQDVERAAERPAAPAPPAAPTPEEEGITRVPLSPLRRTIAQRMLRSWQQAPQVTLVTHADMTGLLARRAADGNRVSINDLVLRAATLALCRHPRLNGWFMDGELVQVRDVNLGVAVAIDDGLVVPVVRAAQTRTVHEIAEAVAALTRKAKTGPLAPADVTDGTFSVSNLGAWGVDLFTPIVNPPQVAILGVGRVNRVPREAPGGFAFVSEMGLCLVFDHRVVDGAEGAAWLQTLSGILGDPDRVFGPAL